MNNEKQDVHDFWNAASCGEALYLSDTDKAGYTAQASARYALEPYILNFAGFKDAQDLKVLEIGVGLGADHQQFAEAGADLWGIDLTERAVEHTRQRLAVFGLASHLAVGDAENLDFADESFDLVYSWGVRAASQPGYAQSYRRSLAGSETRGGGEHHDLPQMEHDWLDAVVTLCAAGLAAVAFTQPDLCPLS